MGLAGSVNLQERYEQACATPSDIYLHLPTFAKMVFGRDARHVIELGTRSGVSTVAWLYALEHSGGHLTSVDLEPAPNIGRWSHWVHLVGDDCDPNIISELEPADIVFIDTSHLYDHTLRELNLYKWLVRRPGLIVLHDTELERPEGAPSQPRFPVKTAVADFCEVEGFRWFNYPECWGLGVIEVG